MEKKLLSLMAAIFISAGVLSPTRAEESRLALSPDPIVFTPNVPMIQPVSQPEPPAAAVPKKHGTRKIVKKIRRNAVGGAMRLTSPVRRFMAVIFDQESRMLPSNKQLPDHLVNRPHDDYPLLFRWIPRSWTAFFWGEPSMMLGNQRNFLGESPKPIGEPGSFQISRFPDLPIPFSWLPLYIAFTTPNGWHVRLGARWDDVDSYIQVPTIAFKNDVKE